MAFPRRGAITLVSCFLGFFFIRFLHPYFKIFLIKDQPEVILVLGGNVEREYVGVRLANDLNLPLVLSGGSNPEHAEWLVKKGGIPFNRVKFDYRPKDTLGNFTSLLEYLLLKDIKHVLVVTSENHLARSMAVGQVVVGSRGIRLTGISVPCHSFCREETFRKRLIDLIRSLAWVFSGYDLKEVVESNWLKIFISG